MDISPNPGPQQWNDSLRVLYLNTRSLKAFVDSPDDCARKICKISLLQRLVYGEDFDVISLCEMWLNPTVLDGKILPGYNIFRRDRDGRGGGVLTAVKNTVHASRRIDLERVGIELVVVQSKPLLLYCFYHPDDSPEPLLELNMSLCENNESTCLVAIGDFNLPELDWSGDQSAPTNTSSRANHNIFCELMAANISFSSLFLALHSCPILSHCYGPLRAVDGSYAPYNLSALLTVHILSTYGACISL